MGRRSYEEIGRPLPNRTTIVVSGTKNFDAENCMTAKSLQEAITIAGDKNIYVSGGVKLYEDTQRIISSYLFSFVTFPF